MLFNCPGGVYFADKYSSSKFKICLVSGSLNKCLHVCYCFIDIFCTQTQVVADVLNGVAKCTWCCQVYNIGWASIQYAKN